MVDVLSESSALPLSSATALRPSIPIHGAAAPLGPGGHPGGSGDTGPPLRPAYLGPWAADAPLGCKASQTTALQPSIPIRRDPASIQPGGHPGGVWDTGSPLRTEYYGPRVADEPRGLQASKPAALPAWHARRGCREAALPSERPAESGLQLPSLSWSWGEERARGHGWIAAEPASPQTPASPGESMGCWAPLTCASARIPGAPVLPLSVHSGPSLASDPGTPPMPHTLLGGLWGGSSRSGVAGPPGTPVGVPVPQCGPGGTPSAPLPLLSGPCDPSHGSLVTSLAPDVVDERAVGEDIYTIQQILLALPTKADLRNLLTDYGLLSAHGGAVDGGEGDRSSDVPPQDAAHWGPRALSPAPALVAPPVPNQIVTQTPDQPGPCTAVVSRSLSQSPFAFGDSQHSPLSSPSPTCATILDELGGLEDSRGSPFLLPDTVDSTRHLGVAGVFGFLQQASPPTLSPWTESQRDNLQVFPFSVIWSGGAPASDSLKLGEAGALYRWGLFLFCSFGPIGTDVWLIASLLPSGSSICWTDSMHEPVWLWY